MLPKQKTTLKEKYAPINRDTDPKYNLFNQTADYYIGQFSYDDQTEEIKTLQNAVEGVIDTSEYAYLLNPFNMDNTKDYKVGAKLRNHNILKGVVYLLLGEYSRRTQSFSVNAMNADDDNKYKESLRQRMRDYYEQETINKLNEAGVPTGQPSKEQGTPQEVEARYKSTYDNERVKFGQSAIDYIKQNTDADAKAIEMYYDWITVGRGYSYKCIRNKDVDYEHVPVEELYLPNERHSLFIENYSFAVRRRVLPLAKIIDYYGEELSEEDITKLETDYYRQSAFSLATKNVKAGNRGFIRLPSLDARYDSVISEEQFEGIPVYHVQWRGYEKVGTLTYYDELQQVQTMEVDDTYVLDKELGDISLEWEWRVCICEDTRIGDDIHCLYRVVVEDRGDIEKGKNKKLSYNGIIQRSKSGTIQSVVKEGFPYQILINGLHFQVEKLINKNKDKILVIPYGLIPRKKGMETKDTMYHLDATSILWVDETAPNAAHAAQMIKVMDAGLGNYIKELYDIIMAIKSEYWDVIGMSAQRYSNVDQGAGKGVTEQAIVRSAIITYDLNRNMDKFLEKDYQGFLDLSKLAWINGKKAQYILSDGAQAFLELNADDALFHAETSYNVFVKDSTELSEGLQAYRSLLLQFAQQSGAMTASAEILTNNNIEKLKSIIARIEEANRKHELATAQAGAEQQKEIQQMISEDAKAERELKKYDIDREYAQTVESAQIRTQNNSRNEPRPANEIETMTAFHQMDKDNIKELQKEKELSQKDKELELKNKQLNIQKSKANGN